MKKILNTNKKTLIQIWMVIESRWAMEIKFPRENTIKDNQNLYYLGET